MSGVSGVVSTGVVVSGAVRSISPPPVAISVQPAIANSSNEPCTGERPDGPVTGRPVWPLVANNR